MSYSVRVYGTCNDAFYAQLYTDSWGDVWEDSHGDWSCTDRSEQGEGEETTRRGETFLQCSGVKATSLCYVVCVTRFLQGLLRYVPIVGSVLSWFSPPTPTTPEGRTFSLSSGLWDVQWNLNCSMQGSIPSPLVLTVQEGLELFWLSALVLLVPLQGRYKPPLVHTSTRCR